MPKTQSLMYDNQVVLTLEAEKNGVVSPIVHIGQFKVS